MKRKILSAVLVIAGLCIIGYPIATQLYANYQANKLMEEIEQQIADTNVATQSEVESLADIPLISEEASESDVATDDDIYDAPTTTKASFNASEILKQLTVLGYIEIPSQNLKYPITEGQEEINFKVGVGHKPGSAAIGELGNCFLGAHRGGIYGTMFKNIDKLKNGDKVILTDMNGTKYTYVVYDMFHVNANETWVIDDTKEGAVVSLMSCENNSRNRIIVRAKIEGSEAAYAEEVTEATTSDVAE